MKQGSIEIAKIVETVLCKECSFSFCSHFQGNMSIPMRMVHTSVYVVD